MPNRTHGNSAFVGGRCVDSRRYETPVHTHPNILRPAAGRRVRVNIRLWASSTAAPPAYRYFGAEVSATVDSGATVSVFTADTAERLDMVSEILGGPGHGLALTTGASQPCRRVPVRVYFGGRYLDIPVLWPINLRTGTLLPVFPVRGDLLGMRGILDTNMLCLTPDALHVFPLK